MESRSKGGYTMDEILTSDLAKFGARERDMAEALLRAWREHGLPLDFNDEEVTVQFNTHSGYVFLTNSDYQVALEEEGKLVSFYSCPECGEEGTWEDSIEDHGKDGKSACRRWVRDIEKQRKA